MRMSLKLNRILRSLLPVVGLAACTASSVGSSSGVSTTPEAPATASRPTLDYLVYVVSESVDEVSLIRFGPAGARVERSFRTGLIPTEINGPHGVAVAPDDRHYFVSVGHGQPFGTLWKYTTDGDQLVDRTTLGYFPASLQVSPDGAWVFVANFNLHGDMVPSSISVVDAAQMVEVARITTCTMPHGSRFNPAGTKHYSTCMMDDALVEIDTRTFSVSRHFVLSKGRETGHPGAPTAMHAGSSQPMQHAMSQDPTCSPTWAESSRDGEHVFVACNKSDEIIVIDASDWTLERRVPAGPGPYNLVPSPDGRLLLATNKRDQSVSIFEIATWRELARIRTARPVVHGVVVSPDNRYAFVSVEGIGAEPGTVEIIDLTALKPVASVDVGQQAAGLDFWKTEPATAP